MQNPNAVTDLLGGLSKTNLNIEDFDPIYRRRDFNTIKRNVQNVIDLKKIYNPTTYKKMLAEAKQRVEQHVVVDQDQIDFRNNDPRKKKIDDEQK